MLAPNRQEVVPRATIEAICAQRDRTLTRYDEAYAALVATVATQQEAVKAFTATVPDRENRYNYDAKKEIARFLSPLKLPEPEDYRHEARRMVDTAVWSHIIEMTDLEKIMDKKAKDEFARQLQSEPPEATVENIQATLQQFMLDADMIFRRGIAECFTKLDRRFRSHTGWKIGHRIILDRCFNEDGRWSYYSNQRDALIDVERVFLVLDGLSPRTSGNVVYQVEHERGNGWKARQSEHETPYFRLRIFKNGNLHIWFTSDELLREVNKLLAEYYGEVIPEERRPEDQTDQGGLFDPKLTPAKNYGFFPTPDGAAQAIKERLHVLRAKDKPRLRILEPSAGTGNLARLCVTKRAEPELEQYDWQRERLEEYNNEHRFDNIVDCVEVQPELAAKLRAEGIYANVYNRDFLTMQPPTGDDDLYDIVVMNPPFDRERDIDHVMHALTFLKPDGFLIAIMSAATEFRDTRKSIAFRELMAKMKARFDDLPPGSFSEVGTNVNTLTLRVRKDKQGFWS